MKIQDIFANTFARTTLLAVLFLTFGLPSIQTETAWALQAAPAVEKQEEETQDETKDKTEEQKEADSDKTKSPKSASGKDEKSDDKAEKKDDEKKAGDDKGETKPRVRRTRISSNDRYSKGAKDVTQLFSSVVGSAESSTVRITSNDKQIAIGTIVDSDGLILTKASELRGDIECHFDGSDEGYTAEVVGVHEDTDLALLKIKKKGLPTIQWGNADIPIVGQWVVSPLTDKNPLGVGVVSVDAREIPTSGAFLGIQMRDHDKGILIVEVVKGTPAERAELEVDDVITWIAPFRNAETHAEEDKEKVENIEGLRNILSQYDPGERIAIGYIRDKEAKTTSTQLVSRDAATPQMERSDTQNNMGSTVSKRKKGFPLAIQHDSHLDRKLVGGPLVNLSGQVVGINIARSGRVASLALPVEVILPIVEKLKSGELAPAVVNKDEIINVGEDLKKLTSSLKRLPRKESSLKKKLDAEKIRSEELRKLMKDLEARIKEADEKRGEYQKELNTVRDTIKDSETRKKALETRKRWLETGKE